MPTLRGFDMMTEPQPNPAALYNLLAFWTIVGIGGAFKVVDDVTTTPPGSPDFGDTYIVGSGASGDWSSHDGELAGWDGTQWLFLEPVAGDRAWLASEAVVDAPITFTGSIWE